MAEFKPNEKQQEFLDLSKCNVLVSASAGSGKTSTMIRKLVKIILDEHASITSLLVVTYTNAAASEIKLKLFNELTSLINVTNDVNEKAFLQEQLNNLNNAEIGTLHAICKKLIVKYFYKIDESPDFSLLSEKDEKYLLDSAVKSVFNRHITSGDDDFFELYDSYNSKRNDIELSSMCLQLYSYKCSKTNYITWRNDFLNSSYNLDINANSATTYLLEHYQKSMLMFSSQIIKLRNNANILGLDKYVNYLSARLQFIDEINRVNNFETAIKVLDDLKLPYKPAKSKNASIEEADFDDEVDIFNKFFNDQLKKFKDDMTSLNTQEIMDSISGARNNVIKLMEIVDEIECEYRRLKKSKNSLDFNDLEDRMLFLLEDEEIRNTLRSRYNYIFVDEYQDINDKQEDILLKLASSDNYYMIGDVKQSIYAFRQSSPKIFISKYNLYSSGDDNNRLINFNANYRSDRNILEFANSVFDKVITRETIGIDYSSDARFITDKEFNGCNVAINVIDNNDELDDKDSAEVMVIAKEITRIMSLTRPDGSRYNYGDIAIILRQRGKFVRQLADTLSGMQIPVSATVNSDFFSTAEVGLLIAILKIISNHKNDIATSIVLKNVFDVGEEELMIIREYNSDIPFYECVRSFAGNEDTEVKIRNFFDFIRTSRIELTALTIKDYLTKVIDKYNILLKVRGGVGGREKEGNILEFLRITDNDNYKYNLDKFLDYLDFISKEKSLTSLGTDANAVQICTIHHSKGLEYPAVILGGMGRKFQLNKDSGNIIINNNFGIGLKSIDNINRTLNETVIRNACKLDNEKSEIDEEIRLLYVAMTRAKEKLSLVGTYNLSSIASNKLKRIYSSKNYFDLLFKSIDNVYISSFLNKKNFTINADTYMSSDVSIFGAEDFGGDEELNTPEIILNAEDEELLTTLKSAYSKRPNIETTTIKNTVTNILREEADYENVNFSPKKLDVSDNVPSIDSLKIGTAYHSIMQSLKFIENKAEIEDIISSHVSNGVIDSEVAGFIKVEQICTAVNTLKEMILTATNVYKEKQFILRENYNKLIKSTDNNTKVIVQGVIDLAIESDNGVYLIDYKTNRGVTAQQLIDEYRLQLEIYAHAFELATGKHIDKKFLYSFSLGQLIEVE